MPRDSIFRNAKAEEEIRSGDLVIIRDGKAYHPTKDDLILWPKAGWSIRNAKVGELVVISRHIIL